MLNRNNAVVRATLQSCGTGRGALVDDEGEEGGHHGQDRDQVPGSGVGHVKNKGGWGGVTPSDF